jgi:hypothetical protein
MCHEGAAWAGVVEWPGKQTRQNRGRERLPSPEGRFPTAIHRQASAFARRAAWRQNLAADPGRFRRFEWEHLRMKKDGKMHGIQVGEMAGDRAGIAVTVAKWDFPPVFLLVGKAAA